METITAEIKLVGAMSTQEQTEFCSDLTHGRHVNFDADVIGFPRSTMLRAYDADGALLSIPLRPVLMYDAIISRPGITPAQEAVAMQRITALVDQVQKELGYGESVLLCGDPAVAADLLFHGDFEEVANVKVLRHKVSGEWIRATVAAASEKTLE